MKRKFFIFILLAAALSVGALGFAGCKIGSNGSTGSGQEQTGTGQGGNTEQGGNTDPEQGGEAAVTLSSIAFKSGELTQSEGANTLAAGWTFTVTYSDNSTKEVKGDNSALKIEMDTLTAGVDKVADVTYSEGGASVSTKVTYTVLEKPHDHNYGAYKVTTVPTKTKTGLAVSSCSICSGTRSLTLPVLTDPGYTVTGNTAQPGVAGQGTYNITVKGEKLSFTASTDPLPLVKVTSVSLNKSTATLTEGDTLNLVATVLPSNATDSSLNWASNNASVASVDANGKVTAKTAGSAKITATAADGSGKSASCVVTVNAREIRVTSVTLNKTSHTMLVGATFDLMATVLPDNATNKTVSWESENTSIATVNSSGRVTAVAKGTVYIVATADGQSARCSVTVNEPEPTPSYSVKFYSDGNLVETKNVEQGQLVAAPANLTKSGYYISGWGVGSVSGTNYNFNTPVAADLSLYAKWSEAAQGLTYTYAGNECAAFEWNEANPKASNVKVEYKLTSESSYTSIDKELIRQSSTAGVARADVLGLKGGATYDFKITDSSNNVYNVSSLQISSYDRSGYAHFNYTSGVGAYNDDGTLKSNAVVVYVTEATKNTVTANVNGSNRTGIVNILKNAGTSTPLVVRVLGTVGAATWKQGNVEYTKITSGSNKNVDSSGNLLPSAIVGKNGTVLSQKNWTQAELISGGYNVLDTSVYAELNGLSSNIKWDSGKQEFDSCWNDCNISGVKNVTVEGVGEDARIFQWGFTWKNSNSIEVRNLTFEDYPEDACSFEGSKTSASSISTFTEKNFWIHHNVFEEGRNYWDVCKEQDKHEGDGSTDLKGLAYVTIAYNQYHNCHKTGLVGGSDSQTTASITFHHNYYNESSSRMPLARQANMHMYNNYYYKSSGTNMSLRAGAYALVENCYFDINSGKTAIELQYTAAKTENNVTTPETYGAIKIINSTVTGKVENKRPNNTGNYYKGSNRAQTVDNTNKFSSNFDTNSSVFYYENGATKVQIPMLAAADVPTQIPLLAGVMKHSGTTGGGNTGGGGGNTGGEQGGNQSEGGSIVYTPATDGFYGNGSEITIAHKSDKTPQFKTSAPAANIGGVQFDAGKAMKMDSGPTVTITLAEQRTVYIYVTVNSLKVDNVVVNCEAGNGYYYYTVNLAAGAHTVTKGSDETALYMISIT